MFQIAEYDFINVYVNESVMELTPVFNHNRMDAISGFNTIEWICK